MTNCGLSKEEISSNHAIFLEYENIEQVILYSTRASGNYKNYSDVDLSLIGKNISLSEIYEIENQIDDLLLPYQFDISEFHAILNMDLKRQIQQNGILFYKK
jgi:predicted nucleotidyltransferase